MNDYLDRLEAELRTAWRRRERRRGRLLAVSVPALRRATALTGIAAIVAVALVVGVLAGGGEEPASSGRDAAPGDGNLATAIEESRSGRPQGARVLRWLADRGFPPTAVVTPRNQAQSEVVFQPGARASARRVADALGIDRVAPAGERLEDPAGMAPVIVVLGADFEGLPHAGDRPPAQAPEGNRQVALRPAGELSASGTVTLVDDHLEGTDRRFLQLTARGLPRAKGPGGYALWLVDADRATRLGFLPPAAGGRLHGAGVLPENWRRYRRIIITRERTANPDQPGDTVLIGRLR